MTVIIAALLFCVPTVFGEMNQELNERWERQWDIRNAEHLGERLTQLHEADVTPR
jgi:hypothetical protein